MVNITQSPHEGLFKILMLRKENARTFLSTVLPDGVLAHIQLESLTTENISYVDDHLKQHYSDLVFSAKLADGTKARIYCLLEHMYNSHYHHLHHFHIDLRNNSYVEKM